MKEEGFDVKEFFKSEDNSDSENDFDIKEYCESEVEVLELRLKEIVEEGLTDRGTQYPIIQKISVYNLFIENSDKLIYINLGRFKLKDDNDITVTSGAKVKVQGIKKWYKVSVDKIEEILKTGKYSADIKNLSLEKGTVNYFNSAPIEEEDMDSILDELFEPYLEEEFFVKYKGESKIIIPIMMLSETNDFFWLNEKWCWDNTMNTFVFCNENLRDKIRGHVKMFKRLTKKN